MSGDAGFACIYNPSTGRSGYTPVRKKDDGSTEILMKMLPGESLIIKTISSSIKSDRYSFYDASAPSQEIKGTWTLEFIDGGPIIPAAKKISKLVSWTETGGEDVKSFSGTATYQIIQKTCRQSGCI